MFNIYMLGYDKFQVVSPKHGINLNVNRDELMSLAEKVGSSKSEFRYAIADMDEKGTNRAHFGTGFLSGTSCFIFSDDQVTMSTNNNAVLLPTRKAKRH